MQRPYQEPWQPKYLVVRREGGGSTRHVRRTDPANPAHPGAERRQQRRNEFMHAALYAFCVCHSCASTHVAHRFLTLPAGRRWSQAGDDALLATVGLLQLAQLHIMK